MDKPRMLSGHEIVAKGVTKLDASLPEIGLKDVIPNGSWLEQKQIQSALEARKHLVEVERIQKFGTLSQAIWRDELKLAEVIQKTGGHWQYMGHNVGKILYLQPEETLFLMETNCLLLKHNDVIVSLQKAYSLILNEINITQYRVYASLSRIGYRILRHKIPKETNDNKQLRYNENMDVQVNKVEKNVQQEIHIEDITVFTLDDQIIERNNSNQDTKNFTESQSCSENIMTDIPQNISVTEKGNDESPQQINNEIEIQRIKTKTTENMHQGDVMESDINESNNVHNTETNNKQNIEIHDNSLQNTKNKIENTSCNENKDEMNTNSMEVDPNVKNEPYTFNIFKKLPNTVKNYPSMLIKESKYEMSDNSTDSENTNLIIVENENLSENSSANDDLQDSLVRNKANCDISEVQKLDPGIQSIEVEQIAENMDLDTPKRTDFANDPSNDNATNHDNKTNCIISNVLIHRREQTFINYVTKLKKLTSRQIKQSDFKTVAKSFENIPDLFQKEIATINVPDQQHIPRNIYVNNTSYTLNIKEIRNKFVRCDSSLSPFSNIEEVNANNIRRIRNNSRTEFNQNVHFTNNARCSRQPFYYRPHNFWRPQNNLNYVSFNMFFQRACLPNIYFPHRMPYIPGPNQFRTFPRAPNLSMNSNNSYICHNSRKRLRNARNTHLNSIKNLAERLKHIIMSGSNQLQNIESLHRLLFAFNNRYKVRLRLTEQFDIVNDENIVETIELDDEDKSKSKRPRLSQDSDNFNENLDKLRQVALKLKDLEAKNKCTPKHKRAMSKAIKTFNKSYDADIYMNEDYEVIDRRFIDIVSDSESDCVITETKTTKRKKLRNPFYILKQRTEKNAEGPSTSRDNNETTASDNLENTASNKYSQHITDTFNESWLPNENDFGRAEVVKKNEINSRLVDTINDEYLYKFIEDHYEDFGNWLEAKIAYLQHMEEMEAIQNPNDEIPPVEEPLNYSGLRPLIDAEDNSDMTTTLEKLRIIGNNNKIENETSLSINYDVYNRDVQNFRKTNPPKPHFRIICIDDTSNFPSAEEVMALHSKYEDNVAIVFAVVGISSISYLQIKPIDLPVYIAGKDLE